MLISQDLIPLRQEKNALSFLNSPVVPAGVIFRKCLTKSSLFSDFALKARQRSILFVSGSGLVKDAGSNCRVSLNWLTISSTSLVERNEMDWMELLTFSGSASSFRVVPWKWHRNHWKNKELHWDVKLIFFFFFFFNMRATHLPRETYPLHRENFQDPVH